MYNEILSGLDILDPEHCEDAFGLKILFLTFFTIKICMSQNINPWLLEHQHTPAITIDTNVYYFKL